MSELYHHGILGMHWGIRRTLEELGHVTAVDAFMGGLLGISNVQYKKQEESEAVEKQ